MSLKLSHTTFDSLDPFPTAEFWRELLGGEIHEPECYRPGSDECYLRGPRGEVLLFLRVPYAKKVKNRAHLDLVPENSTRDAEVERALELGARLVDDRRGDLSWAVLADPGGKRIQGPLRAGCLTTCGRSAGRTRSRSRR